MTETKKLMKTVHGDKGISSNEFQQEFIGKNMTKYGTYIGVMGST